MSAERGNSRRIPEQRTGSDHPVEMAEVQFLFESDKAAPIYMQLVREIVQDAGVQPAGDTEK